MSNPHIEYVPDEADQLAIALENELTSFNMDATGQRETWPVAFRVRSETGGLLGGISGWIWASWLHVSLLWVHPRRRSEGIGGALLAEAERFAISKGCRDAYLGTYDFQAPKLYQRAGYQVFGELDDFPSGHTHFFLHKRLVPPTTTAI